MERDEVTPLRGKSGVITPSTKKTSKRKASWFTPQAVQQMTAVAGVGLHLLEGNKKTRAIAKALRVVTDGLGAAAVISGGEILGKLRATRTEIKTLEATPKTKETAKKLKDLRMQLDTYLDLFLDGDTK